jgi:multiple sugar transport system substrate-binding protein
MHEVEAQTMFDKRDGARLSRRMVLRGAAAFSATTAIGAVLAACGGSSATDTPKAAATTAAASGSGAATTAPAAATTATGSVTTAASAATRPAGSATSATTAGSATTPATTGTTAASSPAAAKSFSGKMTVWGIVSFTKDGDNLLGQQMADWGKANNVSVEYVPLDGSTYATKVSTAIETGSIPDVVMLSGTDTIFYAGQNRLVDLSDVYNDVKGLGGGMYDQLLPYVSVGNKVYSIPMQADLSVMYTRLDLVQQATGARKSPTTWDEVDTVARKLNSPPKLFGIGFTLGRTPDGDGNITQLLRADGGTLVDKDGNPTINNDGTISALTRIQSWWKDKLIPPDSPSWDDSKNNASYQSRQSAFVFNPASIFAFLDQNDKDLLKDTDQAPNPTGKGGSNGSSVGTWSWSIFSASKQVDAGKAMIKAIMQPELVEAVYEKVGGRWYPVYKSLATAPFWKARPYFDAFPDAIAKATPNWLPAQATPQLLTQLSAATNKHIYAEMLQDIVVSNKSPQDAAKSAQTKMEQAFAEAVKK